MLYGITISPDRLMYTAWGGSSCCEINATVSSLDSELCKGLSREIPSIKLLINLNLGVSISSPWVFNNPHFPSCAKGAIPSENKPISLYLGSITHSPFVLITPDLLFAFLTVNKPSWKTEVLENLLSKARSPVVFIKPMLLNLLSCWLGGSWTSQSPFLNPWQNIWNSQGIVSSFARLNQ